MNLRLLIEAIVVGVLVAIIGLFISYIVMVFNDADAAHFDHWGSVGLSFAISGFLVHLLCEYTGLNGWYCKHGNACL